MAISMDTNSFFLQQNMTSASTARTNKLSASLSNLEQGTATDEELMEVLKDFESYFLEQIIKKMKDTFTDEDEESSVASQYTDTFMDYAIEEVADILLEEVGGNMTQQLFEQMKRNYNIPTVDITTDAAEKAAVKVEEE